MLLFLLLQHIADTGTANSDIMDTIIKAAVGALAGFAIRSIFIKPAETADEYKKEKLQSFVDSQNKFEQLYYRTLGEWQAWRAALDQRTTVLEQQQRSTAEQLNEKIKGLGEDVADTKEIVQNMREDFAGIKATIERALAK